jgi:hypothetical protein
MKSQRYMAAYRFVRLLSDLCIGISRPTPEDFFDAYVDHQNKVGGRVCKDTIIKLMLEHAVWLSEEARKSVNVQSWKDFAKTRILDLDEESDVEMDELEFNNPPRPIPSSPARFTLSSKRRRVRQLS